MSKHGGSSSSGLVLPAGFGNETLAPQSTVILEPEVAKQVREREERKRQFERRRIALELLRGMVTGRGVFTEGLVPDALGLADQLIAQTGGEI